MPSDERWVTIGEAAAHVDRTCQTLRKWGAGKKIRYRKIRGKKRVYLAEVKAYAAEMDKNVGVQRRRAEKTPSPAGSMTATEFARRLGLSERMVEKLKSDGTIAGYTEDELAKQLAERGAKDEDNNAMAELRQRRLQAQAELEELKLRERRGEYYERKNVDAVIARLADATRQVFSSMAQSLPGRARVALGLDDEQEAALRRLLIDDSQESLQSLGQITATLEAR